MFIFQLIAMKSIANASHNRSLSEFQQVVLCIKHIKHCKCFYAGLKLIFKTDAGRVDRPKKFCQRSLFCHLHGQTGWFTVWANGNQKSGPLNFVPKSRLPFVQSIPFVKKWARRPKTGIKEYFEEMEHEFPYGHSKPDFLFRCCVAPSNFPLERLKIVLYHFTSWSVFLETFCKW